MSRKGAGTALGILVGLAMVSAIGAACGSSRSSAASASSSAIRSLGAEYLVIATPVSAASDQLSGSLSQLGPDPAPERVAAVTEPMAAVLEQADQRLGAIAWPAGLRPEVDALVRADVAVERDLRLPSAGAPFNAASWRQQLSSDEAGEHSAVAKLRRALRLPALQPS